MMIHVFIFLFLQNVAQKPMKIKPFIETFHSSIKSRAAPFLNHSISAGKVTELIMKSDDL